MALREIFASFTTKFDDKELKKGEKSTENLTTALGKFGALIGVGFLGKKVKDFSVGLAVSLDDISKASKKIGISSEDFQEYAHAAELAGVSSDSLTRALIFLQRTTGQDVATAFPKLIEKIGAAESPAKKLQIAVKNLGRAGAELIPFFEEGSEGIDEMRKDLRELGGVFNEDTVRAGEKAKDTLERLHASMQGFKVVTADLVLPALQGVGDALITASKWFQKSFEGVNLTRVAMVGLATVGLLNVNKGLALLIKGAQALFSPTGLLVAGIAAAVLAVEDLATAYAGGRSVIREFFLDFLGFDVNSILDPIVSGFSLLPARIGLWLEVALFKVKEWANRVAKFANTVTSAFGLGNIVGESTDLDAQRDRLAGSITSLDKRAEQDRAKLLLRRIQTQAVSGTPVQKLSDADRSLVVSRALSNPNEVGRGDAAATVNAQFNITGVKSPEEFAKRAADHLKKEMRKANNAAGKEE